jgi:hypothetical protein
MNTWLGSLSPKELQDLRKFLLFVFELLGGLALLQVVPSYLYSTRRGRFEVWSELLQQLALRGDEQVQAAIRPNKHYRIENDDPRG